MTELTNENSHQIVDPKIAEELAYIQKPGIDASLKRETELKEGLTEIQKENLAVMETLSEKYPHAFIKNTDSKGRPFLLFQNAFEGIDLICQEGVISFDSFCILPGEEIDPTHTIDAKQSNKNLERTRMKIKHKNESRTETLYVESKAINFRDADLKSLKEKFTRTEELHKNDIVPQKPNVSSMIDSL